MARISDGGRNETDTLHSAMTASLAVLAHWLCSLYVGVSFPG